MCKAPSIDCSAPRTSPMLRFSSGHAQQDLRLRLELLVHAGVHVGAPGLDETADHLIDAYALSMSFITARIASRACASRL